MKNEKALINPLAISVVFHIILLSAFAAVKISSKSPAVAATISPTAKIKAVSRLIEKPQTMPKPKIISPVKSEKGIYSTAAKTRNENPLPPATDDKEISKSLAPVNPITPNEPPPVNIIQFFGHPVSQKRLCFVVDCSGSMQGTFEKVKSELKKSITGLEPDCYFQIILFGNGRLNNFSRTGLIRASNPVKQQALDFVSQTEPAGITNATEAITAAMKTTDAAGKKPDMIYFLTDGFNLTENDNGNLLMSLLALRNEYCPKTIINTIGFWPKSKDKVILIQLAQMTGGNFRTDESEK
jgi:hypothetical protein